MPTAHSHPIRAGLLCLQPTHIQYDQDFFAYAALEGLAECVRLICQHHRASVIRHLWDVSMPSCASIIELASSDACGTLWSWYGHRALVWRMRGADLKRVHAHPCTHLAQYGICTPMHPPCPMLYAHPCTHLARCYMHTHAPTLPDDICTPMHPPCPMTPPPEPRASPQRRARGQRGCPLRTAGTQPARWLRGEVARLSGGGARKAQRFR